MLLDIAAVFGGGTRTSYAPEIFPDRFNCKSHGLNHSDLNCALAHLEANGWLSGEDSVNSASEPDRSYRLTTSGGSCWESERLPDWTRYVIEWYGGRKRSRVKIFGHSLAMCNAFYQVSCACGFLASETQKIYWAEATRQLIYWRPPQRVFILSAWLSERSLRTDWSHFEMKRCWWRFPEDIRKLWNWPSAPPR